MFSGPIKVQLVKSAMQHIMDFTCVKFKERKYNEPDFLNITKDRGYAFHSFFSSTAPSLPVSLFPFVHFFDSLSISPSFSFSMSLSFSLNFWFVATLPSIVGVFLTLGSRAVPRSYQLEEVA